MKTKSILLKVFLSVLVAGSLLSCTKKATVKPANNINALVGNWETTQWGGVSGDILIFNITETGASGTVTQITGAGYGFAVGNVIFSDIKANGDGTYSCSASYSATGSGALSTRAATMSLQNNNTQLTVYYPAINSSFPAITYGFQASSTSVVALP